MILIMSLPEARSFNGSVVGSLLFCTDFLGRPARWAGHQWRCHIGGSKKQFSSPDCHIASYLNVLCFLKKELTERSKEIEIFSGIWYQCVALVALEPLSVSPNGNEALEFHWIRICFPAFCYDYLPLVVAKLQAGHKLVYECCILSICSNLLNPIIN